MIIKDDDIQQFVKDGISLLGALVPCEGNPTGNTGATYQNETFALRSYYWGNDENRINEANFIHFKSLFMYTWYKCIGRGDVQGEEISHSEWITIMIDCLNSIRNEE